MQPGGGLQGSKGREHALPATAAAAAAAVLASGDETFETALRPPRLSAPGSVAPATPPPSSHPSWARGLSAPGCRYSFRGGEGR